MSADDQQFLDVVCVHRGSAPDGRGDWQLTRHLYSSRPLPNEIRRYSGEVADFIDGRVDKAADVIREHLASSPWIPESIRPRLPAPRSTGPAVVTSASTVERVQDWIWRHKLLLGVVVLASGTIAYRAYRRSRYCHKTRRARRARSGAGSRSW